MRQLLGLLALALASIACRGAGCLAGETPSERRPNIVFILADDLGYGDLGCYGQKRIETPNIDRLAAEGLRLTDFYAGSTVCAPSRCVLMTGLHTGRCRIRGNARVDLRPEDRTVAEVLAGAGYRCGLFGKWGLGHEGSGGMPTRQGFHEFYGYLDQTHAHNYWPTFLVRNEERVPLENVVPEEGAYGQGVASRRVQYSHDLIIDEALGFIDRHHERPFFLYLAATLPHANNEAGAEGLEVPDLAGYAERDWPERAKRLASMVSRLDRDVGRVLDRLARHGLDRDTVVFFSSDNGPHREGGNDPEFFDSNGPLRGIKRALYEGGIRVPALVRWPGTIPAGQVSSHVGWFADFLPTAAELAGQPAPAGIDGVSLVPLLRNPGALAPRAGALYWEFYEQGSGQAVRLGKWKGVVRPLGGATLELFDLETDIGETRDLAGEQPDVVARLRETLAREHVPSPEWKVRAPRRAPAAEKAKKPAEGENSERRDEDGVKK